MDILQVPQRGLATLVGDSIAAPRKHAPEGSSGIITGKGECRKLWQSSRDQQVLQCDFLKRADLFKG